MSERLHWPSSPPHRVPGRAYGGRLSRIRLLLPVLTAASLFSAAGCWNESADAIPRTASEQPGAAAATAVLTESRPGAVELLQATATLDELNVVRFEIAYRFTSGAPTKTYLCEIAFPGADQWGTKPLEAFELESEGVIRTGIEVGDQPVREFEVTLSEADSPDQGYHLISNRLTGVVQRPEAEPE